MSSEFENGVLVPAQVADLVRDSPEGVYGMLTMFGEGAISRVETYAIVDTVEHAEDVYCNELHMQSRIVVNEDFVVVQGIGNTLLSALVDTLNGVTAEKLGVQQRMDQPGILFKFNGQQQHNGVIVPERGEREWLISSYMSQINETFESPAIAAFFQQHGKIIATLVNVVEAEQLEETPHFKTPQLVFQFQTNNEAKTYVNSPDYDPFSKFVGIDAAVEELKNFAMLANMSPEECKKYGITADKAVLLHGPSGTGKTDLVHCLAEALQAKLHKPTFTSLSGGNVAQWAQKLELMFTKAISRTERVLIFIDEFDGFISGGNDEVTANITAVLKIQLENIKKYPHVFVALTTNNIDGIDPDIRVPKRIPLNIGLTMPTGEAREAIFSKLLFYNDDPDLFFNEDVSFNMSELAAAADGLSGSDIYEAIAHAKKKNAIRARAQKKEPTVPNMAELLRSIDYIKSTKQ